MATHTDAHSRRRRSWQAHNYANSRATERMRHLEVSMMVVTVQSAADPSTLARKAVLAMRHDLVCHGNAAFRTTDFLTSAHARTTIELVDTFAGTEQLGEQQYLKSALHVLCGAQWQSNH